MFVHPDDVASLGYADGDKVDMVIELKDGSLSSGATHDQRSSDPTHLS